MTAASTDLRSALDGAGYRLSGSGHRGATASVFPAITEGGEEVAVKIFHDDIDQVVVDREVKTLAALDHPNIVSFVDSGRLPSGELFLITGWSTGRTLDQLIAEDGPLSVQAARPLIVQFCSALEHVHVRGIVHRDLSPANLIIDGGHLTVIDFGIAQSGQRTATAGSELIGTARYLAPELIEGEPPTAQSDQYAAAIIIYELLTGEWAYGEPATAANVLHLHLHAAPVPLEERVVVPIGPLGAALEQALSKRPRDRFASMRDFCEAAVTDVDRPTAGVPRRWARRSVSLGIATLLGGGLTGGLLLTADDGSPANESIEPHAVDGPEQTMRSDWPAGLAIELACNLIGDQPGFEGSSMPDNYYFDPSEPDRENDARLVSGLGEDESTALALGTDGAYGLFGHIVDVRPGRRYRFEASVVGVDTAPWAETEIGVVWLGEDFQPLDEPPWVEPALGSNQVRVSIVTSPAPTEAAYAVTRLYKNASAGTMLVDELVFSDAENDCSDNTG